MSDFLIAFICWESVAGWILMGAVAIESYGQLAAGHVVVMP